MAAINWTNLRFHGDDTGDEEFIEVSRLNGLPTLTVDLIGNVLDLSGGGLIGGWNYYPIVGQTTNVIKASTGILHALVFNKPVATSVVTIYDGRSGTTGTLIATITIPASPMMTVFPYDLIFGTGLTVIQATASSDITVLYR